MRVLIIGAGLTGSTLAARLCQEQHDVVVVDRDASALADLGARHDVMVVEGAAANPKVMDDAGITKTDLIVAVTGNDELNLLACSMAKRAGVERTVAHVKDSCYGALTDWYSPELMGVDRIVSENDEGARELFNILMLPSASEVVQMLDGRVQAVGVRVTAESPLFGAKLESFPVPKFLDVVRMIAIMRGGELLVPRGDTVLFEDDQLYVLGTASKTLDFVNWAYPNQHETIKVIIAGGGGSGLPLAQLLEDSPKTVVLIESDPDRASYCSSELNGTLVLHGDALDANILNEAGITEKTTFVAVTGSDEKNILTSILAKKYGVPYVVAQMNLPERVSIAEEIDALDRVVSAKESTVNAILHLARWRSIEHYAFLQKVPGELLDFDLGEDSKWVGKEIQDVSMPHDAIIAAVVKGETVMVATGRLELNRGDRVIVFAQPKAVGKVEAILNGE